MPRGPRLDAPGALHHVMARGIERCDIFRDDIDRDRFVESLISLARRGAFEIFAWALMPNHFHLLVKTTSQPLGRSMRCLLTRHAVRFNRRHGRVGHLFQNRYKSVICQEDKYFLELVRYIHLNPVRGGLVAAVELEEYRYTGHSVLLAPCRRSWQRIDDVLTRFAGDPAAARDAYRRFVTAGVDQGRRPDLVGGGLVRSAGGWQIVKELRRGREAFESDERVLGDGDFVRRILRGFAERTQQSNDRAAEISLQGVIRAVTRATGVRDSGVLAKGRLPATCRTREGVAYLWVERLGRNGRELARALGVHPSSVYRASQRGRDEAARWDLVLRQCD
ncbi:MAG: transposase [Candidatus Binatia bacterium]